MLKNRNAITMLLILLIVLALVLLVRLEPLRSPYSILQEENANRNSCGKVTRRRFIQGVSLGQISEEYEQGKLARAG